MIADPQQDQQDMMGPKDIKDLKVVWVQKVIKDIKDIVVHLLSDQEVGQVRHHVVILVVEVLKELLPQDLKVI